MVMWKNKIPSSAQKGSLVQYKWNNGVISDSTVDLKPFFLLLEEQNRNLSC